MPEESRIKWFSADISGRVASPHKLDSFQANPLFVSRPPESMLFSKLSQKGNNCHCAILVGIRQVYFVTEDNQPFTWLFRSENDSRDCLDILTIVLELFHDETGVGRRGEVDKNHLEIGKCL